MTEVTSGQVVTVYNRPSTATANLFFNSDLSDLNYNGTDITLNKRMSHHFSVTGAKNTPSTAVTPTPTTSGGGKFVPVDPKTGGVLVGCQTS